MVTLIGCWIASALHGECLKQWRKKKKEKGKEKDKKEKRPVYYAYSQAFWHQTVAVWDSEDVHLNDPQ